MSKTIETTYFLIYKTTNIINGKIYIGKHKTKNLNDGYIGSGKLLKRAINKYGRENFKFEILNFFPSEEEMNEEERMLVTEEFCLRDDTYNLCVGGQGGFSYINREGLKTNHFGSRERDQVIAASIKGRDAKRRLFQDDPQWEEDYKKKISKSVKEHYKTSEGHFKGKFHTEKTKILMSQHNRRSTPIEIYGKYYHSMSEACRDLNLRLFKLKKLPIKFL